MVPESPTVTNNPVVVVLSVLLEPSSLLLLQEMKVELKRRRKERMMSRCFTWFPFWLIYENIIYTINRFVLQECGDRVGIVRILLGVIFGGLLF